MGPTLESRTVGTAWVGVARALSTTVVQRLVGGRGWWGAEAVGGRHADRKRVVQVRLRIDSRRRSLAPKGHSRRRMGSRGTRRRLRTPAEHQTADGVLTADGLLTFGRPPRRYASEARGVAGGQHASSQLFVPIGRQIYPHLRTLTWSLALPCFYTGAFGGQRGCFGGLIAAVLCSALLGSDEMRFSLTDVLRHLLRC